jgi:hypothetical protein
MSCANFDNCRTQEVNKMAFPTDDNSLYAQKIYDEQTAASKCYNAQPIVRPNIVEGFSLTQGFTWKKIITIVIIILLILLFISLFHNFEFNYEYNRTYQQNGGFDNESYFELTAISELHE